VDFYKVRDFYNGVTFQERYIPVGLLFGLLPFLCFFTDANKYNRRIQTGFFITGLLFLGIISDLKIISRIVVFATLGTITSLEFFVLYFLLFWGLVLSYVLSDWRNIIIFLNRKIHLPKWLIYFTVIFILCMGVNRNIQLLSDCWRSSMTLKNPLDLAPQGDRTRRTVIPDEFQWWRVPGWIEKEHDGPVIPYHGVFAPALKYGINGFFTSLQLTMMHRVYDLMRWAHPDSLSSVSGITLPMLRLTDDFVIAEDEEAKRLLGSGQPNQKNDFLIISKTKDIESYLSGYGLIPNNHTVAGLNTTVPENALSKASKVYTNMEIASIFHEQLTDVPIKVRPDWWILAANKLLGKSPLRGERRLKLLEIRLVPIGNGSYRLFAGRNHPVEFRSPVYGLGSFEIFLGSDPLFFRGLPSLNKPGALRELGVSGEKRLFFYSTALNSERQYLFDDEPDKLNDMPVSYLLPLEESFQWQLSPFLHVHTNIKNQLTLLTYNRDQKKMDVVKKAVSVAGFSPNHLMVEVNAERNEFLYYADAYHERWYCEVDGKPVPVLRANFAYKAVVIPVGKHSVKFYYDPQYAEFALKLFYIILVIVPIWTCSLVWFSRKK